MKQIGKRMLILLLCIIMMIESACLYKEKEEDSPYKIYYVNADKTALVEQPYRGTVSDVKTAVKEMLKALKTQENVELIPAIPDNVEIQDYTITEGKIDIEFGKEYRQMDVVREVLCRAAVVRSLTQIPGIDQVLFLVDGAPLTNREGESYGYMQESDFVQNTGSSINAYEETSFELYFSNKDGDRLIKETVDIRTNSSQTRERAAVECLMKGPKSGNAVATIPKDTELLNVSIKDGVCYLNFNEGLTNSISGVKPETIIYSIVNTVIECGNVGMVQIAINGESDLMFQECIKLGEPLTRNLDIVETGKE